MDKLGLIIKSISGEYVVEVDGTEYTCKPIGLFRYKKITPRVGDKCIIDYVDGAWVIKDIKKRKNELVRPVVANIDKVIIVTSLTEPDLNLNLLDRLICQVEYSDIPIVLVFSKADLVNIDDYKETINYYKNLDYKVYTTPTEVDELKQEFNDCICVLAGQSGVGKSNLINNLDLGINLKTGEISNALGRGKHTTRHTELYKIGSGYLADTPGFGALDLETINHNGNDKIVLKRLDEIFNEYEVDTIVVGMPYNMDGSKTFRADITEKFIHKLKCKYNPCYHLAEPGCKIKEEVDNGHILKSRYDNYLLFLKEIKEAKQKNIYKKK